MAQPDYVPLDPHDRVRAKEGYPAPGPWWPDRPADLRAPGMPAGRRFGSQGPDQGYGLKLARALVPKLTLAEGEHTDDAVAGCFAVGTKRAALFGRAPVIYDYELAYTLFGFLGGAPADLVAWRRGRFQAAAEHYELQRAIADGVPESTLRLVPADVRRALPQWRSLLVAA